MSLFLWTDYSASGKGHRLSGHQVMVWAKVLRPDQTVVAERNRCIPGRPDNPLVSVDEPMGDLIIKLRFEGYLLGHSPYFEPYGDAYFAFKYNLVQDPAGSTNVLWCDHSTITAATPRLVRISLHSEALARDGRPPEDVPIFLTDGRTRQRVGKVVGWSPDYHQCDLTWDWAENPVPDGEYWLTPGEELGIIAQAPLRIRVGNRPSAAVAPTQIADASVDGQAEGAPGRETGNDRAQAVIVVWAAPPRMVPGTDLLAWSVQIRNEGRVPVDLGAISGDGQLAGAAWRYTVGRADTQEATWRLAPAEQVTGELVVPSWMASGLRRPTLAIQYQATSRAESGGTAAVEPLRTVHADLPALPAESPESWSTSVWAGPPMVRLDWSPAPDGGGPGGDFSWSLRGEWPGATPWTPVGASEAGWLVGAGSHLRPAEELDRAGVRWQGQWQDGEWQASWERRRCWEGQQSFDFQLEKSQSASRWRLQVGDASGPRLLIRWPGSNQQLAEVEAEPHRWALTMRSAQQEGVVPFWDGAVLKGQIGTAITATQDPPGAWGVAIRPIAQARLGSAGKRGVGLYLDWGSDDPTYRLEWSGAVSPSASSDAAARLWLEWSSADPLQKREIGWSGPIGQIRYRSEHGPNQSAWSVSLGGDRSGAVRNDQGWEGGLSRRRQRVDRRQLDEAEMPAWDVHPAGEAVAWVDHWQVRAMKVRGENRLEVGADYRQTAGATMPDWSSWGCQASWQTHGNGALRLNYQQSELAGELAAPAKGGLGTWRRALVSWTGPPRVWRVWGQAWECRIGLTWAGRWADGASSETSWYPFLDVRTTGGASK